MKKIFLTVAFLAVVGLVVFFTKEHKPQHTPVAGDNFTAEARQPSAIVQNQQAVIDQMTKIILSISTKEEVLAKAEQVIGIAQQQDPKNEMPGVQLIAGYMKMLSGAEGIVYRMRPIVEPSDWLHMQTLFWLRTFRYNSYTYGKHIAAIFDFVTTPSTKTGPVFKNITELQAYLVGRVAPLFESFVVQAKSMDALPDENFNFTLDRTLFVGVGEDIRFLSKDETNKKFIKPFLYSTTFAVERVLGSIYYWSALNVDDLPSVASGIIAKSTINETRGKLRGTTIVGKLASLLNMDDLAKGITPIMVFEVISKYPNYFSFRTLNYVDLQGAQQSIDAQVLLNKAYRHGYEAAAYELAAFNCAISYGVNGPSNANKQTCVSGDNIDYSSAHANSGQDLMFNPNQLLIDYKVKKAALIQRWNLFYHSRTNPNATDADYDAGKYVAITSEVTGKKLNINAKALFDAKNSPNKFFPSDFTKKNQPTYKTADGLVGWNYDHGYPIAYKSGFTFGGFFDAGQVSDFNSFQAAMTTLVYTKSISPFAVFLSAPSPITVPIPLPDTTVFN